jgi:hypothetical protein
MATNVFISFRFSDGYDYKEHLDKVFEGTDYVRNFSENEDRSHMSEDTIKKYLYGKLRETSVTIAILTPQAVEYKTKQEWNGSQFETKPDDWLFDELKYSLEDRENNRTNGVVAIYTPEARDLIMTSSTHSCHKCNYQQTGTTTIHDFNNLIRKNMFNIKDEHKHHQCSNVYHHLNDHYISLVSFEDFTKKYKDYIDNAIEKRERLEEFEDLVKRM